MALSIGELVGYVDLDTGPAETAKGRMDKLLGGAASSWKKVLGGAGIAAGAAFATSLVGAMNVEAGRDRVAAALLLTGKQSERAGKVAGSLYADGWGASADDVNVAVEAVMSSISGMRNASTTDLEATAESALALSEALGVDVGRAAQVAGQMVRNGLAKDAGEAFDLLAKASSKVPVELREDVLDATDEYGKFFAQVGIKGPEAMGMLAKGAEQGMYGIDKTGDAIKEFSNLVATDMARTKPVIEGMGLDYNKLADDMARGGTKANKATRKIVKGLLDMGPGADQAAAAVELFGTPLEDLGQKDVPRFLQSLQGGQSELGKFAGSTKRMGDTLRDNAAGNLARVGRQLKSSFVSLIGGKVLPVVTELTGSLADNLGPALSVVADATGKVVGWFARHEGITKTLAAVLGTLLAITAAHGAAMAVSAAGGMAAWLMQTRLISAATRVWTAVQWALSAAMSANPIGLIVAALAAVAVALVVAYKKSDTFRAIVNKAFSMVKKVVGGVLGWLSGAVKSVIDFVRKHWRKIISIVGGPIGLAVALVTKHWDKIKAVTSGAIGKVVGFVKSIPGKFKSALSNLRQLVTSLFSGAMTAGLSKVRNLGSSIVGWVKGIPGMLGRLGSRFASAGRGLLQGFIDGMKNAAGIIAGIAGNVWDAVKGLLNGAISKINAALEFKISLPLGKSIGINPPDIPHLATGGRATSETLAVIGEGREPESVLPDSVLRGLLDRAHAAGAEGRDPGAGHRGAPLIGQVVQAAGESADTLAERLWFKTRTRG